MKKLILLAMIISLFFTVPVFAQVNEWQIANQITIAWDPVTTTDGGPIPVNDVIEYEIYWVKEGLPKDSVDLLAPLDVATDPQFTFTFIDEGNYILGVRTVRIPEGAPNTRLNSTVSWTDDPAACLNGETFGVIFYQIPKAVIGLRPSP